MKRIKVLINETVEFKHEIEIVTDKDIDEIKQEVEGIVNDSSTWKAEEVYEELNSRGYDTEFIEDDGDRPEIEFSDIWEDE